MISNEHVANTLLHRSSCTRIAVGRDDERDTSAALCNERSDEAALAVVAAGAPVGAMLSSNPRSGVIKNRAALCVAARHSLPM